MKEFLDYLSAMEEKMKAEAVKLNGEERQDDANLTKVRANVYGICKSVLQVLDANKTGETLSNLQTTWENSLRIAREHEDVKKTVIEQIKLEALEEIRAELGRWVCENGDGV